MNLRELLTDDDAVSPVIGVILMVAITVILAAVIATFVLGLGDSISDTAPQASFSFDYDEGDCRGGACGTNDGGLGVTHDGGSAIKASELFIRGASEAGENGDWATAGGGAFAGTEMISAGQGLTVNVERGDTIRVVWQSEEGTDSATLGRWSGPDA